MSVQVDPDDSRPDGAAGHGPRGGSPAPAGRGAAYAVAAVLLAAPFVALMWVSSYAKDSPRLFGFPFFYWYQFLWVLIASVSTYIAYLLVRRVERPRRQLTDRSERRGSGSAGGSVGGGLGGSEAQR